MGVPKFVKKALEVVADPTLPVREAVEFVRHPSYESFMDIAAASTPISRFLLAAPGREHVYRFLFDPQTVAEPFRHPTNVLPWAYAGLELASLLPPGKIEKGVPLLGKLASETGARRLADDVPAKVKRFLDLAYDRAVLRQLGGRVPEDMWKFVEERFGSTTEFDRALSESMKALARDVGPEQLKKYIPEFLEEAKKAGYTRFLNNLDAILEEHDLLYPLPKTIRRLPPRIRDIFTGQLAADWPLQAEKEVMKKLPAEKAEHAMRILYEGDLPGHMIRTAIEAKLGRPGAGHSLVEMYRLMKKFAPETADRLMSHLKRLPHPAEVLPVTGVEPRRKLAPLAEELKKLAKTAPPEAEFFLGEKPFSPSELGRLGDALIEYLGREPLIEGSSPMNMRAFYESRLFDLALQHLGDNFGVIEKRLPELAKHLEAGRKRKAIELLEKAIEKAPQKFKGAISAMRDEVKEWP